MKTRIFHQMSYILILMLFLVKGYAQVPNQQLLTINHNVSRPTDTLGITEVDLYVTKCYDLYDQTTVLSNKLNAIEQHAIVSKTSDIDTKVLEQQLDAFKALLPALKAAGNDLIQASSLMIDKVTGHLKTKPFKIPGAIARVKNATKAVKVSVQIISTMLTATVTNVNNKIAVTFPADTSQNKQNGGSGIVNTGKTMKTNININGMGFSAFNSLADLIKNIPTVKSTNKKFSSGKSEIEVVHYGSTEDLLTAILNAGKDVVTDKNISGSEKGKISFTF